MCKVDYIIQSYDTAYSKKRQQTIVRLRLGVFLSQENGIQHLIMLDAKRSLEFSELKDIAMKRMNIGSPT